MENVQYSIKQALLDSAETNGLTAGKVLIGANLTLVQGRYWGMASTLSEPAVLHNYVDAPGSLESLPLANLLEKLKSDRLLEASLGMAALNSVIEPVASCEHQDAYEEIIKQSTGKNVAVIGHFPFVKRLSEQTRNCWVFERRLQDGDLPSEQMPRFLPQADVLVLTAQVIPNNCFHKIISLAPQAFKIMLGPSTPLSPVLFDFGIDVLGGVRVTDSEQVQRYIAQGAHFKQLRGIEKITLKRNP